MRDDRAIRQGRRENQLKLITSWGEKNLKGRQEKNASFDCHIIMTSFNYKLRRRSVRWVSRLLSEKKRNRFLTLFLIRRVLSRAVTGLSALPRFCLLR